MFQWIKQPLKLLIVNDVLIMVVLKIKNIKDIKDFYESNQLIDCDCNCENNHAKISRFFCNKHYNIKLINNGQK